jgi:threonine synthase
LRKRKLNVWRYKELLPIKDKRKIVSLEEGGTPIFFCQKLSKIASTKVFVKNEGMNPTGSFKDRGMTVGVSKALELKMNKVACASTGNTSASLAAYAAKAGIKSYVFIPYGKIALGKLAQAFVYGAEVIAIEGSFDEALKIVVDVCRRHGLYLLNSINPFRLEGQKTIAYEIVDQLGFVPDKIILPVGNAGNISAIWKGFKEYFELGFIDALPKMVGIQAEGANPIVKMIENGEKKIKPISKPETVATAIRIGNPVNWPKAVKAVKESKGTVESVSDKEILDAQKLLAEKEGLFVEPASAASIAGLLKLSEKEYFDIDEKIVCIATGSGLKDPDIVVNSFKDRIRKISSLQQLDKLMGD